MKNCKCRLCLRHARLKAVVAGRSITKMRAAIVELEDVLGGVECDLNYCEAILDGSWPGAKEILKRGLKMALQNIKQEEAPHV